MPESEHLLHQRVNILLVDDEPANLLALEAVLGQLGETLVGEDCFQVVCRQALQENFALSLQNKKPQPDKKFAWNYSLPIATHFLGKHSPSSAYLSVQQQENNHEAFIRTPFLLNLFLQLL